MQPERVQLTGDERYRRQVLFTLGLLWALTALGLLVAQQDPNPQIPHERLPLEVRAAFWAVPAGAALVATWYRRIDPTAWALLCVPPLERAVSFAWAWWVSVSPWSRSEGYPSGWRSVLVYGAIIFLINRCAVGLDRARVKRRERGTDERMAGVQGSGTVGPVGAGDGVRFRADPEPVAATDTGPVRDDHAGERRGAVRESPRGPGADDRAATDGPDRDPQ